MWAAVLEACGHGQLRRLRALLGRQTHPDRQASLQHGLVLAANGGHLRLLQYLTTLLAPTPEILDAALRGASRRGYLAIVQQLDALARAEGLPWNAGPSIEAAIDAGQVAVVEYLYPGRPRSPYWEDDQFVRACGTPHLAVIQYLVEVQPPQVADPWYLAQCLRTAAEHQDRRRLAYLLTLPRGERAVPEVLIRLCDEGSLAAVQMLLEQADVPRFAMALGLAVAAHSAHEELVGYLLRQEVEYALPVDPPAKWTEMLPWNRQVVERCFYLEGQWLTPIEAAWRAAVQRGHRSVMDQLLWTGVGEELLHWTAERYPQSVEAIRAYNAQRRLKSARRG